MSDLSITADGTLLIKASQDDYLKVKELLFGLMFNTSTGTSTIVAVGYLDKSGAFIQMRNEDILTVAYLYVDEEVFNAKNLKQSDLKISLDEDRHLTCRLKEIGDRVLYSI